MNKKWKDAGPIGGIEGMIESLIPGGDTRRVVDPETGDVRKVFVRSGQELGDAIEKGQFSDKEQRAKEKQEREELEKETSDTSGSSSDSSSGTSTDGSSNVVGRILISIFALYLLYKIIIYLISGATSYINSFFVSNTPTSSVQIVNKEKFHISLTLRVHSTSSNWGNRYQFFIGGQSKDFGYPATTFAGDGEMTFSGDVFSGDKINVHVIENACEYIWFSCTMFDKEYTIVGNGVQDSFDVSTGNVLQHSYRVTITSTLERLSDGNLIDNNTIYNDNKNMKKGVVASVVKSKKRKVTTNSGSETLSSAQISGVMSKIATVSCLSIGTGKVQMKVTISNSGSVTKAEGDGTPLGNCMAGIVRRLRFPAISSPSQTFLYTIEVK